MSRHRQLILRGSIILTAGCFSPPSTSQPPETTSTTESGESSDTGTSEGTAATSTAAPGSSSEGTSGPASTTGNYCGDGVVDDGEECDDSAENCSASCEKIFRRVFVTSQLYTGDLGGIDGANAKCQTAASMAGLSGVYLAWLSSAESSPDQTFKHSSVPYRDLLGNEIAADWAGLTSGSLKSGIFVTEKLNAPEPNNYPCQPTDVVVWTGTGVTGTLFDPLLTCTEWKGTEGVGELGGAGHDNSSWTQRCTGSCPTIQASLYCFEQ